MESAALGHRAVAAVHSSVRAGPGAGKVQSIFAEASEGRANSKRNQRRSSAGEKHTIIKLSNMRFFVDGPLFDADGRAIVLDPNSYTMVEQDQELIITSRGVQLKVAFILPQGAQLLEWRIPTRGQQKSLLDTHDRLYFILNFRGRSAPDVSIVCQITHHNCIVASSHFTVRSTHIKESAQVCLHSWSLPSLTRPSLFIACAQEYTEPDPEPDLASGQVEFADTPVDNYFRGDETRPVNMLPGLNLPSADFLDLMLFQITGTITAEQQRELDTYNELSQMLAAVLGTSDSAI